MGLSSSGNEMEGGKSVAESVNVPWKALICPHIQGGRVSQVNIGIENLVMVSEGNRR